MRLFPPRQRRIWRESLDTRTTSEKGHGRRERRTLTATTALNDYLDWPGVGQVGRIESVVERDGKTTTETRYFITSVPRQMAGAEQLLRWSRGHWTIENRSHHVRDVSLGEDASRIRKGSGAQVMAALRNLAVGFLRSTGAGNIAEERRTSRRALHQVGYPLTVIGPGRQSVVFCASAIGTPIPGTGAENWAKTRGSRSQASRGEMTGLAPHTGGLVRQ